MAAQYARGAMGLALTAGPLALLRPAPAVAWALGAGAVLFLVYCARSVLRHLTRIDLVGDGIVVRGPFGAAIRWEELRSVRLDYYATQRDRSGGWMQLVLRGARRSISIDSGITGFADIAREAAREAARRGRTLDERTRVHLAVLGIGPDALPDAPRRGP